MQTFDCNEVWSKGVATLTLGSGPRQGVGRWRAKKKTRESHHMLPGVQRVWRHEPSHSQVNSHVGSWSPERTPKSSERNCNGQNSSPQGNLYIIRKLLKRRCLKWARIAHLNICNTSYGQKNGRESNWQFDSRPLKIGNPLDFRAWRWRATYCWKALDEGYKFAWDLIAITGLHKKLCALKFTRVPVVAISGLGSLETKNHLDVAPMERHKVYYEGEGGGFPQVWAVVNLVCPCCPWLVLAPKVFQLCTNHLVWVVCKPMWVNEACQLFLVPSRSSNMPLYPSKCCELESMSRLFPLPLFSTWTYVWVLWGVGSVSKVVALVKSFPTVCCTLLARKKIQSIPNFLWSGVKLAIWLPTFLLAITCVLDVQMGNANPF